MAGVVAPPSAEEGDRTVVLPFESQLLQASLGGLVRHGSYGNLTLVTINYQPRSPETHSVAFLPRFEEIEPDAEFRSLDGDLFLLKNGLQRKFVYKYPDASTNAERYDELVERVSVVDTQHVAVVLPGDATETEIGNTGQTSIPKMKATSGEAKLYPGMAKYSGGEQALLIQYRLASNKELKVAGELLLKLFGGILAPTFALFLMKPVDDTQRVRLARGIWFLVLVQSAIVGFFVVVAIGRPSEDWVRSVLEIVIAVITAALTFYAAWEKSKSSKESTSDG